MGRVRVGSTAGRRGPAASRTTTGRLLRGDAARAALLDGIVTMTALLRPTLGPVPRTVAITRALGNGPPEVLDDSATIVRRTIGLADPFADMGAMLVRDLVRGVHERAGDGGATAAVIAERIVRDGVRVAAAGGNVVALRRGIEAATPVAVAALRQLARPVDGPEVLTGIVRGAVRDERLAELLGEVVDSVGPVGAVLVEKAGATDTSYEYVDGLRWDAGYASAHFVDLHRRALAAAARRGAAPARPPEAAPAGEPTPNDAGDAGPAGGDTVRLLDVRLLITDQELERAEQLLPAIEACVAAGERRLVVIAPEVRDSALALLLVNLERGVLDGALALQAPSIGAQRTRILEDIAVATGGRCLRRELGERPEAATLADLGRARQVWATRRAFGILGGRGTRAAIRARLAEARAELARAGDDPYLRATIRERMGKLAGTAAVVRVGAPTVAAADALKARVEAAVETAQTAMRAGVVPGGGAALLAAARDLAALEIGPAEAIGAAALARALAEPLRCLARNAGHTPEPILDEAQRRGPEWTFDVVAGEWVEVERAGLRGIADPLPVVVAAVEVAASAAVMALTTEALVRRSPLAMARA